jgi:hypothetical protein
MHHAAADGHGVVSAQRARAAGKTRQSDRREGFPRQSKKIHRSAQPLEPPCRAQTGQHLRNHADLYEILYRSVVLGRREQTRMKHRRLRANRKLQSSDAHASCTSREAFRHLRIFQSDWMGCLVGAADLRVQDRLQSLVVSGLTGLPWLTQIKWPNEPNPFAESNGPTRCILLRSDF